MNTIWKFPIAITDRQSIQMPAEFSILHVGLDPTGQPCIWAAVNAAAQKRAFEIVTVCTGNPLPHVGGYVGSFNQGPFVWHVFTGPGADTNRLGGFHYQTRENGPPAARDDAFREVR